MQTVQRLLQPCRLQVEHAIGEAVRARRIAVMDVAGTISVDGEREIERYRGEPATVTLTEGPWRIDVGRVLGATRLQRAST